MTPEFSRWVDIRGLPHGSLRLEADPAERVALAKRIGIESIERFEAEIEMQRDGPTIDVAGRITADITQMCAISNEPFATRVDEPVTLRFVPETGSMEPEVELEIDSDACDEISYEGTRFDLGEELAQTLALAIDPYATGPNADRVRQDAGLADEASSGPFAALAALKRDTN
ncbi:DUF177 domain-containing protein [Novosphingobium sp. Gsoil 351]|uniref:YceD family protein n=1 Tax=Novosphingobium sp. Gsoil 351 TaxID=2675225 RepID=UPI0012B459F6|nr:DUF177 domain-containing protein [Novosphingobium sp. Gsoil 351]QGN56159.1 DUF177 domain-containing protein [Novosphingobium sp. Gsoil 351]